MKRTKQTKVCIARTSLPTILLIIALSFESVVNAQKPDFPYDFSKKDYVILPISALIYFGGDILSDKTDFNLGVDEIRNLDRNSINSFDRPASYNWNRKLNKTSDILSSTIPILPVGIIIPQLFKQEFRNIAVYSAMYLEVYFLTNGITSIVKSAVKRTRPYLYNSAFTPEERFNFQGKEAPEANSSFFSGHTSRAFAAAVFLSKTFTDIYGKSVWSKLIWATSLSAAAFTGYCRVAAGEHFATDVIAGAIVGSAIGYAIPALHKSKIENLSYMIVPNSFTITYSF